jgi:hypothetical protein
MENPSALDKPVDTSKDPLAKDDKAKPQGTYIGNCDEKNVEDDDRAETLD